MNKRIALLVPILALLTAAAATAAPGPRRPAAPPPFPQPAATPVPDFAWVSLETEAGTIVIQLDGKHAPVTTGNFLRYVDTRRFDGTSFYRAMKLNWGDQPNGLVQGGTRNEPRRVLPPIAHEPTSQTGITHKAGTVSMAANGPGTATGDFFIVLSDIPGLDADAASGSPGFAAFGHVVSGLDVARRIFDAPRSETLGEGVMRGQMLDPAIRIISARRTSAPAPQLTVTPIPATQPAD